MSKKTGSLGPLGMAEARLRLPGLAEYLAKNPERVVEVTRRGEPVLHLVAPPRVSSRASAARRILQRLAALEKRPRRARKVVSGRYKDLLYGDA